MTHRQRQPRARLGAFALLLIVGFLTVTGGFARALDTGHLVTLEMRLAPFLAAGGSLADLCEDGELYCPGCAECATCCLHMVVTVPAESAVADLCQRLVAARYAAHKPIAARSVERLLLPQTRAPPVHV
ncbi:MAG: hypothetical protein GW905_01695 [Rhodobacterales bacterium]|nr:hypothetical protein [Rhodobacterales bacterium]